MSRRDNQFHNNDSRAWIEVMGRNLGGGVTLTTYAENGDERHGVRLCDHASVSLDATKLRGLAARLAREADALDGAAASSGERVDWQRVCDWMRDPQRKPADMAFTAGPERQLAYAFEDASGERVTDEEARFYGKWLAEAEAWEDSNTKSWEHVARTLLTHFLEGRAPSSGREAPSWDHKAPPTQDELRALIDSDPLMLAAYSAGKNESAAKRSEAPSPAPALPGPGSEKGQPCTWTLDGSLADDGWDVYVTACGHRWEFTTGTPGENHCRFCMYCGRPLADTGTPLPTGTEGRADG